MMGGAQIIPARRDGVDYERLARLVHAMPALSIRQPYVHHILHHGRHVVNRRRATHLRGWFLIHASKSTAEDPEFIRTNQLQLGGIVGAAQIVNCVTYHSCEWFTGPYGYVIRDAFPLPFVPCPGRQGFFRPDAATLEATARQFMELINA